jgi:hypothetical protein
MTIVSLRQLAVHHPDALRAGITSATAVKGVVVSVCAAVDDLRSSLVCAGYVCACTCESECIECLRKLMSTLHTIQLVASPR